MKIVHIAPNAPFNDGWGYQDNLLPKYHQKLGHEVTLFITTRTHKNGRIADVEAEDFISKDGFRVVRLPYHQYPARIVTSVLCKFDVYDHLISLQPDLVFCHGVISATILDVIRYKKYRIRQGLDCRIIQDNHSDYHNSGNADTFTKKCLRFYYRLLNKRTAKQVEKIYGVTPWRKQYLEDYFGINPQKTDVLIMGADDEQINFAQKDEIRRSIRQEYQIAEDDFVISTGGKIDAAKNIHHLMEACRGLEKVKLLVFGSVLPNAQEQFDKALQDNGNVIYIGWLDSERVYDYFLASDLIVFPGTHSVLWEQACATKVPCAFSCWDGMEHVNNGGNAVFLENTEVAYLQSVIKRLHFTPKYQEMKKVAQSEATDIFLYSEIAKKALK